MKSDRWKPERGSRVRILPPTKAAKDEPAPPCGVWYVIERGPQPLTWWVKAVSLDAQLWARQHPGDVVSGCWLAPGNRLDPINRARI